MPKDTFVGRPSFEVAVTLGTKFGTLEDGFPLKRKLLSPNARVNPITISRKTHNAFFMTISLKALIKG
jgi:hypothetical protein